MQISKQVLPKSEVQLTVVIPAADVKESYNKALAKIAEEVEIKGFRKGKAPISIVEKEVDKKVVYETVIKDLINKSFAKVLEIEKIKPLIPPKAELLSASENKDWTIKYTACLRPSVNLKNYKQAIINLKASKKPKLIIPGQKEPDEKDQKTTLNEILNTLITETEAEISDLLAGDEANRQLSKLLDELQRLGLTVDQYLASKNTNVENLRAGYLNQARDTLKLEFILDEIANSENISVNDEDIQKALTTVQDEKEREALKKEQYYLAAVIRKQKTIDFLENL